MNDLTWRKSSYSGNNGGTCVELASLAGGVAVRDSKDPAGGMLTLTREQWSSFIAGVKSGSFG